MTLQDPQDCVAGISQLSHHVSRINTPEIPLGSQIPPLTVHQDRVREACLPMLSSICLELTAFIRHQQRLSDDLQISDSENLLVCLAFD